VYWSIVDDEKFAAIYDDDRHLATWLRLLLIADQAHPSSPAIPTGCRKASIAALVEAELIDLGTGNRYRVHGLDAERERRRIAATSRGPNGTPTVTGRSPDGIQTRGLRRDETRRDETSRARNGTLNAEISSEIGKHYGDYDVPTLAAIEARKRA
jgi:hypothetical protein